MKTTSKQAFLYNDMEVVLTGRTSAYQKRRGASGSRKLFEITPIDKEEGDWNKFVTADHLRIISTSDTKKIEEYIKDYNSDD